MDITVNWNGAAVPVTLRPVERDDKFNHGLVEGLLRGSFGSPPITIDRRTRRIDDAVFWEASSTCDAGFFGLEDDPNIGGRGDSPQAAVDALAASLKALAQWSYSVLHPGEEPLHLAENPRDATACNAIGRLRYIHERALFENLVGVVPTCDRCVEALRGNLPENDGWSACSFPDICRRSPTSLRDGVLGHEGACGAGG